MMNRRVRIIATTAVALLILLTIGLAIWKAEDPGQAQPIPFSHRIHAQTKNISCLFCHNAAPRASEAGIPQVEKCLLCHSVIASNFPPIAQIRAHQRSGKSIVWHRIDRLPEFVHFSHQIHIARKVDCGQCHGDVKQMDRVKQVYEFGMGFCVDCHRKNDADTGCYTCHY